MAVENTTAKVILSVQAPASTAAFKPLSPLPHLSHPQFPAPVLGVMQALAPFPELLDVDDLVAVGEARLDVPSRFVSAGVGNDLSGDVGADAEREVARADVLDARPRLRLSG